MNMRERIARALAQTDHIDPEANVYVGMKATTALEARLPKADAVLNELLTPDPSIVAFGATFIHGARDMSMTELAHGSFTAMIRAAMEQE